MTDDSHAALWTERMEEVDEDLWDVAWERWLEWKTRHGESYFRLGAPTKIKEMATNHVDSSLPAYTP